MKLLLIAATVVSILEAHHKGRRRGKGKDKLTGFSTLYYPGSTIRNASTGFYENDYMGVPVYRVGCQDEDLFFKVSFFTT